MSKRHLNGGIKPERFHKYPIKTTSAQSEIPKSNVKWKSGTSKTSTALVLEDTSKGSPVCGRGVGFPKKPTPLGKPGGYADVGTDVCW
jgi:hypothetical protein